MDVAEPDFDFQYIKWCALNEELDELEQHLKLHCCNAGNPLSQDITKEFMILLEDLALNGKLKSIERLLTCIGNAIFNDSNKQSSTLLNRILYAAVTKNNAEVVKLSLDIGAEANYVYHGKHIIHAAVSAGQLEIAELLFEAGADIHSTDRRANGILHNLIMEPLKQKDCVTKWLISKGVNCYYKATSGKLPIHTAAAYSPEVLSILVETGQDVNIANDVMNDTPLHVACGMCNQESILVLIQHGAKFNLMNNQGQTPLAKLLKSTQEIADFHTNTRVDLARRLIQIGFKIHSPIIKTVSMQRNGHNKNRNKMMDRYLSIFKSISTASTLQNISRCVVRDNIVSGVDFAKSLGSLEIPFHLKTFILFRDTQLYY